MNRELWKFGNTVYIFGGGYILVNIICGYPLLFLFSMFTGGNTLYFSLTRDFRLYSLPILFILVVVMSWKMKISMPSAKITQFLVFLVIGSILLWVPNILDLVLDINWYQVWWGALLYGLHLICYAVAWILFALHIRKSSNNIAPKYRKEIAKSVIYLVVGNGITLISVLVSVDYFFDILPITYTFNLFMFLQVIYTALFPIGYFRLGRTLQSLSEKNTGRRPGVPNQMEQLNQITSSHQMEQEIRIGPACDSLSLFMSTMGIYSFLGGSIYFSIWVLAILLSGMGIIFGIWGLRKGRSPQSRSSQSSQERSPQDGLPQGPLPPQIEGRNPRIMSVLGIIIGIVTLYLCFNYI